MALSFTTIEAALSMGFIHAAPRSYLAYRGCCLVGHDTSGRGFKGLSFGLRVAIPEEYTSNYLGVLSDKIFGHSVEVMIGVGENHAHTVSTKSPTTAGWIKPRPMSPRLTDQYIPMFEPETFAGAIDAARSWTDQWFCAHPLAVAKAAPRAGERRAA